MGRVSTDRGTFFNVDVWDICLELGEETPAGEEVGIYNGGCFKLDPQ